MPLARWQQRWGVLMAFVGIVAAIVGMVVIVPLALLLHLPLRALHRRGTVRIGGDSLVVTVDREAFRHE